MHNAETETVNQFLKAVATVEKTIKKGLSSPEDAFYITNAKKGFRHQDIYCWCLNQKKLELTYKSAALHERWTLSFNPYALTVNGLSYDLEEVAILLFRWKQALEDLKKQKAVVFRKRGVQI